MAESNFADYDPAQLAAMVSNIVFQAGNDENAGLNAVEVFINRHTDRVLSSRAMDKTQVRYTAMVEAIPTYNGEEQKPEIVEMVLNCPFFYTIRETSTNTPLFIGYQGSVK
jgi:hypothetical protein